MSGASWSGSVRLPQCWPRRVRSAAVQAISLADFAFTRTLSSAADSPGSASRQNPDDSAGDLALARGDTHQGRQNVAD